MRRDIEFTSGGETVRGWLYTPDAVEGPCPVIVMAGGWCYVKELVQPHVAQEFADAGMAAILFDYRNFGSSDGERRQHIDPNAQIEDYKNAISFAETLDEVDPARIGVWGLSYSGGHVAHRRRDRSARGVHLGADPGHRRLPQHAPRPRDDRLPEVRAAADRRSPPALRHWGGRVPPTCRGRSECRGLDVAVPRDLRDVPRSQAARGAGLRESQHDRVRRAAHGLQRQPVSSRGCSTCRRR